MQNDIEKYKILCALNQKEQFGEEITEAERATAVSAFWIGRNNKEEIDQYKKRMRVNPKDDYGIYVDNTDERCCCDIDL